MRLRAAVPRGALLLLLLVLGLAGGLALPPAAAQEPPEPMEMPEPPEPSSGEVSFKGITVRAGEVRHGDIYQFAPQATIEGTQDGDVYIWAPTVRIPGVVTGDLFFAGSQLDISGKVEKSVRAFGANVVIDGEVEGNVLVTGASLILGSRSHIKGNVSCFTGQLTHSGVIDGTLKFAGGTIELGGKVLEDAEITADTIRLEQGARIEGDLSYSTRNRGDERMKTVVGGDVSFDESSDVKRQRKDSREESVLPSKSRVVWKLLLFTASFLFGCALLALFGAHEARIVEAIRTDALRCTGVGFVSILVTIAVCLSAILIVTIIFIPIYLILYALAVYLAKIPVALWIGRTILAKLKRPSGPYLALFVGLIALYLLFALPFAFGWILYVVTNLLGLGAMITTFLALREAKRASAASPPAAAPIAS